MAGHPANRRFVEQVGAVVQIHRPTRGGFGDRQRDIAREIAAVERRAGAPDRQRRLEQRRVAWTPIWLKTFEDVLEGNVAMRVRFDDDVEGATHQFAECRIAGDVGPEHHRLAERADEDVGLSAVAIEEDEVGRQDGDEQRRVLVGGELTRSVRRRRCAPETAMTPRRSCARQFAGRTLGSVNAGASFSRSIQKSIIELTPTTCADAGP